MTEAHRSQRGPRGAHPLRTLNPTHPLSALQDEDPHRTAPRGCSAAGRPAPRTLRSQCLPAGGPVCGLSYGARADGDSGLPPPHPRSLASPQSTCNATGFLHASLFIAAAALRLRKDPAHSRYFKSGISSPCLLSAYCVRPHVQLKRCPLRATPGKEGPGHPPGPWTRGLKTGQQPGQGHRAPGGRARVRVGHRAAGGAPWADRAGSPGEPRRARRRGAKRRQTRGQASSRPSGLSITGTWVGRRPLAERRRTDRAGL